MKEISYDYPNAEYELTIDEIKQAIRELIETKKGFRPGDGEVRLSEYFPDTLRVAYRFINK